MGTSPFNPQQDDDQCADLISALDAAEQYQVHLRKKQRNQAFVCFTKAFACSVHCVHVVQEGIPALVDAIELVENSHKDLFAHLGKPPVLQACILLLFGERLQDLPCPERALAALNHDVCYNSCYNKWTIQLHLKPEDLDWAINLGRFKTALRMVSQDEYLAEASDQNICRYHLEFSLQQLYRLRPDHPATYEASHLSHQLHEERPSDLNHVMDSLECMLSGALCLYHDPAATMHHLLHTMYFLLMDCYGKPCPETKSALQHIANEWTQLWCVLGSRNVDPHGNLWECVSDRMQAAVLLLGHTFPLEECLNGHPFVQFVQCSHTNLSAHLETSSDEEEAESCPEEKEEGKLQEFEHVVVTLDDPPLCSRCNKHLGQAIAQKTKLFPCKTCHSALYCSAHCQQQHYVAHRGPCKRHQLRSKLKDRSKT